MDGWMQQMAMVGGLVLPLFNVPLILAIRKRRSSEGLSMTWALGVWVCIVMMTPQALRSEDIAFRVYGVVNIIFFTIAVFYILKYRRPLPRGNQEK